MPEILRGDLAWMSLGGVLQLVESERTSGSIEVSQGRIAVATGRPVHATHGDLVGVSALLQALITRSGPFRVVSGEPPAGKALGDVAMLVLEGCRLADELDRVGPLRLRLHGEPPADPIGRRLLEAMDGDRTVTEVLAWARVPAVVALDPLLAMLEARTVVPSTPGDRPAADMVDLVDRARAAVRAKDLAEAARLFRQAAELAPGNRLITQNLHRVELMLRQSS